MDYLYLLGLLAVVLVLLLVVVSKIKSPTQNDLDFDKGKEHAIRGYERDKGQSEAYNDGYSSNFNKRS